MIYIADSKIHGKGIFTDSFIIKDEHIGIVCYFDGQWLMYQWGTFVNHYIPGNTYVIKINTEIHLFALTDIAENTELTSDYFRWNKEINEPKLDVSFLQ